MTQQIKSSPTTILVRDHMSRRTRTSSAARWAATLALVAGAVAAPAAVGAHHAGHTATVANRETHAHQ